MVAGVSGAPGPPVLRTAVRQETDLVTILLLSMEDSTALDMMQKPVSVMEKIVVLKQVFITKFQLYLLT